MAYHIRRGCVCCHYCRWECPAQAIAYKGPGYQIDPQKCISCGKCAEVCHSNLIYDLENPEPEVSNHDTVKLTCDVLIIGAGGVGTGAAAKASELGYDVVLIEASKHYGGGTYYAHGAVFPASDVVYGRLGIPNDLEETTDFIMKMAAMTDGTPNAETLRENVRANGRFIDWFDSLDPSYCAGFEAGSPGFPFKIDMPRRHINTKAKDDSIGPGWMGSWVTDKLFETAMKNGVRYYNETRAREFITNEDGTVIGVIASDPGGSVEIYGKAFVLGTGGYLMNDELMNAIDPNFSRGDASMVRLNVPTNVGDGHDMVAGIGGDVDYGRGAPRGPTHHPYSYAVNKLLDNPENVFFSEDGDRFLEMSNRGHGGPPLGRKDSQPDPTDPAQMILHSRTGKCYVVMDSDLLEIEGQRLVENIMVGHDDFLVDWRQEIENECALEDWPARKADTIEELAVKLGMDPKRLRSGVDRYNELCGKRRDEDFGKKPENMHPILKPPFYGFLGQNFDNGASIGGISIDNGFHVTDKAGRPFDGVYCAGDAATYDFCGTGPSGLCGGLGGSWASGYQIAIYIDEYLDGNKA